MSESMYSEYNQRQLKLMRKQIQFYEIGKMELDILIQRLESFLSVLENADEKWEGEFLDFWANLEIEYADAIAKGKNRIPDHSQNIINDSINGLKRLINDVVLN